MAEKKATVKINADTKGFKKGLQETQKGLKGVQKETKLSSEAFSKLGATFTGIFGAQLITKTVSGLASINKELFDIGVKAQGVSKAFNNIAGSSIEELREATKGTVSDLQLMQSAVKGSKFGIDAQKMPELLKFAGQAAKDMGEDVGVLSEKISTAIGRKSLLILDDFGITATQVKAALGGMSAEAATVDQLTDAVLKIAEGQMQNYTNTLDAADAYNVLLSTIENVKLEGGEMLTNNQELKETIESLTNTIISNAPAILSFITDWGKGAIKIADYMAEIAGFWADVFGGDNRSDIETQIDVVSDLNEKLKMQKKFLEDLKGNEIYNATKAEINNAKKAVEETNKEYTRQQMILNNLVNLKKAESKLEEAKASKVKSTGAITQSTAVAVAKSTTSTPKETTIRGSNISDEDYEMRKNVLAYEEQIQKDIEAKENAKYEAWLVKYNKEIEQIALEEKLAKERNQMILSTATASINAVNSIVGIVGNETLNTFGKLTGSIGATSGLIDMFLPGVGSLIGAGASLLGGLFGQKEEESTSAGISSTSASALKSDTTRPSSTVTRTGPEVQNNYLTLTVGNWLGDEQGINDLSSLIAEKIGGMQAGMA